MREIIFRGKRVDNGEWVEGGSLLQFLMIGGCKKMSIAPRGTKPHIKKDGQVIQAEEIFPETVGQYTGLTDKNGTRVFEGDIVKITGFHTTAIAAVKYGSRSEKSTSWGWYFDDNNGHTYLLESQAFFKDYNAIIIGNIHDNPELLKGE